MRPLHTLTALALIPSILGAGCASLDTSARGEGTGIQIIGAVIVLAKYRASERQKAIAEEKARRAFVDLGLRPAYEARAKKLERTASRKSPSGGSASRPKPRPDRSSGGSRTAEAEPEPERDPSAEARAELAALSSSWKSAASSVTNGRYAGDFAASEASSDVAGVDFPRVSESQVLAAAASYAPRYIAVSVPADQPVAGAKDQLMIWDSRTQQLASDTVYAVDRTPPEGQAARIDDVKAQYAGQ